MFSFCSLAASTPVLVLLLLQRLTRQKLGTIFKPVAEAGDFYPKFYVLRWAYTSLMLYAKCSLCKKDFGGTWLYCPKYDWENETYLEFRVMCAQKQHIIVNSTMYVFWPKVLSTNIARKKRYTAHMHLLALRIKTTAKHNSKNVQHNCNRLVQYP